MTKLIRESLVLLYLFFKYLFYIGIGFPGGSVVKKQTKKIHLAVQETWVRSLGRNNPLAKEMVTHSSVLAWRIPWREKLGGLQSIGLQKRSTILSD